MINDEYNSVTYEINGDNIVYRYPIDSDINNNNKYLYNKPNIYNNDNNNNTNILLLNHDMLALNILFGISIVTMFGFYAFKCYNKLRETISINNNNVRRNNRIDINNLNTLLLCEELPDESCSICLEEFKTGDNIKKLNCTHIFHKECLEPWLNNNINCPMCRTDIL